MEDLSKCPVCGGAVRTDGYGGGMFSVHCTQKGCLYVGPMSGLSVEYAAQHHNNLCRQIRSSLAPRADLDRVTAERDAALAQVAALERIADILAAQPVMPDKTGDELDTDAAPQCAQLRQLMKENRMLAEDAQHANGELDRVEKERDALKADNQLLTDALGDTTCVPPSEICRTRHLQNCHACDRADCCDNITPSVVELKKERDALKNRVDLLEALLRADHTDALHIAAARDAARAELEALKRRIADAPVVEVIGEDAPFSVGERVALVRLEDTK